MDAVLIVDTLVNVLVAVCGLLAAIAVIFLVVRPVLDPHWRDGLDASSDDAISPAGERMGEANGHVGTSGMQGT